MDRVEMQNRIDAKASTVRSCYITVGVGQESTYLLKAEQAQAFVDAGGEGDVPLMVQAEVNATGASALEAAQGILAVRGYWIQLAAYIESVRLTGKNGVRNAATDEDAETAFQAALDGFCGLMP